MRIATFYGPVWLVILMTLFIYVKVGMVVFRWRKQQLRSSSHNSSAANFDKPGREYPMGDMGRRQYEVTITSQVPHNPEHKRVLSSPRNTWTDESVATGPTLNRFASVDENTAGVRPTRVIVARPSPQVVDANKAALSYCKTAMLFFIALICVWYVPTRDVRLSLANLGVLRVPSTVNRVYTLVRPNNPKFGLEFSSGLVLPLQGCWNTVIYIVTSLPACKALWSEIFDRPKGLQDGPYLRSPPLTLTRSTHQTLPSTDNRADILMSFDGKKRIIHHDSRAQSRDGGYAGPTGMGGQAG